MTLKLLIGLPTNRAQMFTATAFSLTSLVSTLLMADIPYVLANVDSVDIVSARNSIATRCVRDASCSHLLFIDDDMGFDGDSVLALLRASKDVVGVICPRRTLDLDAHHKASAQGLPPDQAAAHALSFIVRTTDGKPPAVTDEMCELAGIGMGLTLIRRTALTTMIETGAVTERVPTGGRDTFGEALNWSFFEQVLDQERNMLLSEDHSFCHRWREGCGGKIFGLTHETIAHVGHFDFEGRYADALAAKAEMAKAGG